MKKLEILVPQYNEPDSVIKPLLDSIAIQQNVDFSDIGVIICNDGSDTLLSAELLGGYPYSIEYHREPHRGVSGTRNACLDYATAEYVMFCDADDMFFNACGLWVFFRDAKENEFDTYVPNFLEESRAADTGNIVYLVHSDDCTFVHGKIHRRQYLIDENIRWNEDLTVHEDSYFNILCQSLTEKVHKCPTAFYLWKWRQDSVCRHDPKYMLKTYHNMIKSNDALIEEFKRRGRDDREKFYVVLAVFDAYYTMNKPEWVNQENIDYRDDTERRFAAYFRKYKGVWDSVGERDKMYVSSRVRARSVHEGMGLERMTVTDWLAHIEALE